MKISKDMLDSICKFEQIIDYKFKNKEYILEALTHSSYSNENKKYNFNERLEFLGDSVLSIVVSDYLFKNEKELPEGELTKLRASIVCEESLSEVANKINLGEYMLLGKGEEATGGRERISILADAFEAVIAAIYLDGSIEDAKKFEESTVVNESELDDGYSEELLDEDSLDDEDALFEEFDDEEILLDDTDLGADNLLNDQDILDDEE